MCRLVRVTRHRQYSHPLAVTKSANKDLVGLQGIVIQETEGTFTVVTRKDKMKVLPKPGSTFTFRISLKPTTPDGVAKTLSFDISGSQFAHRAEDRVVRKFKSMAKPAGPAFGPQI